MKKRHLFNKLNINMEIIEQKSKTANIIFYTILALLILASVGVTFYKIVILKDYQIVAEVSCDPTTEKCFVYECNPDDDDACSQNPEERISYYKKISKKANTIYLCEKTEEKIGCGEELYCVDNEQDCSYTVCDSNNLGEGEKCSE